MLEIFLLTARGNMLTDFVLEKMIIVGGRACRLKEQIEILRDLKPQLEEAEGGAQNWLDNEMATK